MSRPPLPVPPEDRLRSVENEPLLSLLLQADEVLVKAGALDQARALRKLVQAARNADAYLADPSGHPLDAINFAREELKEILSG